MASKTTKKQCLRCDKKLPATREYFYWNSPNKDGSRTLKPYCIPCEKAKTAEWRAANPEAAKRHLTTWRDKREQWRRDNPELSAAHEAVRNLKRRYDMTQEDVLKVVRRQKNSCAICKREFGTGRAMHIDHDHETGDFRGLLCQPCNMALGLLQDDPGVMRAAARYVAR